MALGQLPPWLQINPSDYLRATQAGVQAGHAISEATTRAFEEQQRMQMQQDRAQSEEQQRSIENAATRLAQDRLEAYRQSEMKNAQQRFGLEQKGLSIREAGSNLAQQRADEVARHNQALEAAKLALGQRQAEVIDVPGLPGYKAIKNPSGSLTVVQRPTKDLPTGEKLRLQMQAQGLLKTAPWENVADPAYQSRTNLAQRILGSLSGGPSLPQAGTNQSPFKIISIRKRDQPVPEPAAPSDEELDTEAQ